jgi:hypothetical protein
MYMPGLSVRTGSQEIPRLFMEPKGLLPYRQESATGTYPEPDASSPHLSSLLPLDLIAEIAQSV